MRRRCLSCGRLATTTRCAPCTRAERLRREPSGGAGQARRAAIIARDEGRCVLCGSTRYLEVDHIVPLAAHGTNDAANLRTLCRACHDRRG